MTLLEKAQAYHDQADAFLRESGLLTCLAQFGSTYTEGAYAGNVMLHGDVDLGVVREKDFETAEMFDIAKTIHTTTAPHFMSYYIKGDWADPKLGFEKPMGRLIMLKAMAGDERWNFDIWFVSAAERERRLHDKRLDISSIPLTPEQRETILGFKQYRKDNNLSIPGQKIYELVVKEGATDPSVLKI
jgi:hypothetical protein